MRETLGHCHSELISLFMQMKRLHAVDATDPQRTASRSVENHIFIHATDRCRHVRREGVQHRQSQSADSSRYQSVQGRMNSDPKAIGTRDQWPATLSKYRRVTESTAAAMFWAPRVLGQVSNLHRFLLGERHRPTPQVAYSVITSDQFWLCHCELALQSQFGLALDGDSFARSRRPAPDLRAAPFPGTNFATWQCKVRETAVPCRCLRENAFLGFWQVRALKTDSSEYECVKTTTRSV